MSDTPYPAPEVNLPRDGGEMLNLADFRPNGVVLFFYPKANTPGCTKESIGFSEAQAEFKALGI
jgi:peroxiredoxin Q/BCP